MEIPDTIGLAPSDWSVSLGIFRRWLKTRFKRHRIGPEVLTEDLLAASP